jgi:alkylhydroperoxidase family enzyme
MFYQRSFSILLAAWLWAGWTGPAAAADPPATPRFPLLGNDEAWERLPRADPELPAWARTLAPSAPRATVALLGLDHLHRTNNPLGPVLVAKVRWVAADAMGCDYAKRYAEADLRRAGLTDPELKWLGGDFRDLPAAEQAALTFARKLTRAGYTVTDAEVADLLDHLGAEKVVALAHTVAFANFQDRLFLGLGVQVEPGGPLPPLDVRLDPSKPPPVPARPAWEDSRKAPVVPGADVRAGWAEVIDIEKALDQQKNRKLRIPLPRPEQLARVSPDLKAESSLVLWTTVSAGYQPLMTKTWFDCSRTFQQEAKLDRVFSGSLFWVVTRSNECFY